MPFYTYRCNTCGLEKDFLKSMGDTKTQLCPKCCYNPNVNGDDEKSIINNFVNNMLSRDSLCLRQQIRKIAPDIDLKQEVEMEGEMVEVDIPLTTNFFWPTART